MLLVFEMGEGLEDKISGDESISESKIDWLYILKKDLKSFEVDSNLEEVRWVSFILGNEDWLLETKSRWEDEIASTSLIVEGSKDETFSWDESCKVAKLFLGRK